MARTEIGSPYTRKPLHEVDGIPVFAGPDEYTENYRAISDEHLQHLREYGTNPWFDEARWVECENATRAMLARHGPGSGRLLDAGVGLGRLVAGQPYELYGFDISLGYLQEARQKNINVCFARVEDLPYRDGWFDAITCTDVLEHVLDLNLCVKELLRVLKPGGVLVVRVPFRESLEQYIGYKYRFVHFRIFDGAMLELVFDRVFGCTLLERAEVAWEVVAAVRKP